MTAAALLILAAIPIIRSTESAEPARIWLLHHGGGWLLDEDWKRWRVRREKEEALSRPPPDLPIRPGDYARFARECFGFVVDLGPGYRIDSFRGLMTKQVLSGRDTTIALRFTSAEMDSIYRETIALRIFDLEEPSPRFLAEPYHGVPHEDLRDSVRVELRAGSATKHLAWFYSGHIVQASDDWKRLNRWMYLINRTAEANPAYRALPLPMPSM